MNRDIRRITDGAMMAAIIGVMLFIDRQTAGMISGGFVWLLPIPMVFYSAKYGMKNSWMLFIAVLLLTFVLGTPQTWFYMVSEILIGILYGSGIYNKTSTRKLVIRTILLAVVADVLSMLVFASFFGYDIASEVVEYQKIVTKALGQAKQTLPSNIDLTGLIRNALVVSVVVGGVLNGLVTHLLSRLMLKRLRIYTADVSPISSYYPPKWSGYIGILGLVMFYYSSYNAFENALMQSFLQGFGMIGVMYLAAFGVIAAMIYTKMRFHVKGFAAIVIVIFAMMMPVAFALFGYFYITTDLHDRLIQGVDSHAYKDHEN